MKNVKAIFSKDKLSRSELSQIYKMIKELELTKPWLDQSLLRSVQDHHSISYFEDQCQNMVRSVIAKFRPRS